MKTDLPESSRVWQAIDTYIGIAYEDEPPSATVRSLLATLRSWAGPFYVAPVFARTGDAGAERLTLRLGNRHYPHMKLVLEPSPDGSRYLFKADTHDRHVCPPPGNPEHEVFRQLMQTNQRLAERIETVWAEQGLPTFKTYLRDDLARRQAASEGR
jgi:hypothetical protein